jgi:hypothetical protein
MMRKSLWLLALVPIFSLLFFAFSLQAPAFGQRGGQPDSSPSDRRWICQLAGSVDSADHAITIVDPDLGSIAVYHPRATSSCEACEKSSGIWRWRSTMGVNLRLTRRRFAPCSSVPADRAQAVRIAIGDGRLGTTKIQVKSIAVTSPRSHTWPGSSSNSTKPPSSWA